MHNPNSNITRFLQWLADAIDPMPPYGEAWCMNCSLVGGKTAVINSDGLQGHVRAHSPGETLNVKQTGVADAG